MLACTIRPTPDKYTKKYWTQKNTQTIWQKLMVQQFYETVYTCMQIDAHYCSTPFLPFPSLLFSFDPPIKSTGEVCGCPIVGPTVPSKMTASCRSRRGPNTLGSRDLPKVGVTRPARVGPIERLRLWFQRWAVVISVSHRADSMAFSRSLGSITPVADP